MKWTFISDRQFKVEEINGYDIKFRNFAGRPTEKNRQGGQRTFNLALPDELAEELTVRGWRVKFGKEKDDGSGDRYPSMINVKVSYKVRPPRIVRVTPLGHVDIDEELCKDIDGDEIDTAAMIINGSMWDGDGKFTPYLENMRYKMVADPFEGLYED